MNTDLDPLLTRDEVAKYLNVTERTVLDWAQREVIPAIKLAGSWRFRRKDIESWLQSQSTGPDPLGSDNQSEGIQPKPFRSAEREQNIRECISAMEFSMQDSDQEEWAVYTFQVGREADIVVEAIARMVKAKIIKMDFRKTSVGEKYEVIKRRKA